MKFLLQLIPIELAEEIGNVKENVTGSVNTKENVTGSVREKENGDTQEVGLALQRTIVFRAMAMVAVAAAAVAE